MGSCPSNICPNAGHLTSPGSLSPFFLLLPSGKSTEQDHPFPGLSPSGLLQGRSRMFSISSLLDRAGARLAGAQFMSSMRGLDLYFLDSFSLPPPAPRLLLGLLGLAPPFWVSRAPSGWTSKFSSQILAGTSSSACGRVSSRGNLGQWLNRWTSGLSPTSGGPLWPVLKGSSVAKATEGERSEVDASMVGNGAAFVPS